MATKATHYIPPRAQAITPYLIVHDGKAALDWYTSVLGAEEDSVMAGPDGMIMHAEIRIGDSQVYFAQEMPGPQAEGPGGFVSPATLKGTTTSVHTYVPNVDEVFARALANGATEIQAPSDQFWGDRYGVLLDPFGHRWAISTHIEDVTPEEMAERQEAYAAQQGG